jgi:hypothetical protein
MFGGDRLQEAARRLIEVNKAEGETHLHTMGNNE